MKKKLLLSLAAAAMVGTLAVGGTLAWFTDTETAVNVVTTGNVNIAWYEGKTTSPEDLNMITKEYPGMQFGSGEDKKPVVPGQKLDKVAIVSNEGRNPAYIRAKIIIREPDGTPITNEKELALLKFDGMNELWVKSKNDDYYYYTNVVDVKGNKENKPSQTEPIMTSVTISPKAYNSILADKEYRIELVAEAVQADELGKEVKTCQQAFGLDGLNIQPYAPAETKPQKPADTQ